MTSDPFEKFQWSNPGSEYRGHWKDGSAAFQNERNNVVGRYAYTMKEYGFSMEVQETVDYGHNLEGVVGRGRGRGAFGRGGRGMVRGLGIAGRGGAAGMFRGFGGALVGRGRGGVAPAPIRGGAPGPVRGGAPWAVIPHPVPHAPVPIPPPAADMDEEGEELDDPEMDLEPPNPPVNPDEGLDFEFYQNTPIPRINAGKLAFRTFVQQIKPLKYKRGMIILVLHQNGTTSLFAISNIKPYLLSTRYLSDPSMLTFRTNGMAGCLELAESPSDPLLTSHFYSKILKPNMDPLMIYGNHKYVANLVLTLE